MTMQVEQWFTEASVAGRGLSYRGVHRAGLWVRLQRLVKAGQR